MRAPKKHSDGYRWSPPDAEWLEQQYLTLGKSKKTIAAEVGSGQGTVRRWLREAAVTRASIDGSPRKFGSGHSICWTPPSKKWLEHRYITLGIPAYTIALKIGADGSTVMRWLKQLGIPQWSYEKEIRYRAQAISDKRNYRWAGGRSGGYILELALMELEAAKVPEQCSICDSQSKLDIHHKDGDRTNNVLENLQYLCRSCHVQLHKNLKRSSKCL